MTKISLPLSLTTVPECAKVRLDLVGGSGDVHLCQRPIFVGDAEMSPYEITYPGGSTEYWNEEEKKLELDLEDDILKGCVLSHGGSIVNETIKNLRNA